MDVERIPWTWTGSTHSLAENSCLLQGNRGFTQFCYCCTLSPFSFLFKYCLGSQKVQA